MVCISPPELDMALLLMALDGEADPATLDHLERCAYCRGRADELSRMQSKFSAMLYRADCPPAETLGEYHHGRLPAGQASSIRLHVSGCPNCRADLAAIEEWIGEFAAKDQPSSASQVIHYLAQLVDSGFAPLQAAPALRGDSTERGQGSITLVYQTDLARIALEVSTPPGSPDQRHLSGTVIGPELPSLTIYIWQDNDLVASTWVDPDRGTFEVFPLPPGMFDLSFVGEDVEIRITKLSM